MHSASLDTSGADLLTLAARAPAGAGDLFAFAVDTRTRPGRVLIHALRLETLDVADAAQVRALRVRGLSDSGDARLALLAAMLAAPSRAEGAG